MDGRSLRLWLAAALFAAGMVYLEVRMGAREARAPESVPPKIEFIEIE